jgi:L-iditol 2-dehydrogenase
VVVYAGHDARGLKIGDRVAIEPGVPCGECPQCSSGSYNLCADVKFSGAPPHHGSIRRYHTHPSQYLHKIPDPMSFSDGALLEPLSVVLHAFERSPVKLGESAVILGAGPIGLIALATARASGAYPLVIADVDAGRLKFAERFVPECLTVQVQLDKSPAEMAAILVEKIRDAGGEQPRVVYECTGVQSSVITAAYTPRAGGEVMVVGVGTPILNQLPFMHISLAEVSETSVSYMRMFDDILKSWNLAKIFHDSRSTSNLSTAIIILGRLQLGYYPQAISI